MKLQESKNGRPVGARARHIPEPYVCIDTDATVLVLDYLNGSGRAEDSQRAALHLKLCLHCQEVASGLKKLNDSLAGPPDREVQKRPEEETIAVALT